MKKLSKHVAAITLALILALVAVLACTTMAEELIPAPSPEVPAGKQITYTVDITKLIIAAIGIVMSYIMAWIAKKIVPPVQAWLAAHTTHEQRETLARLTNEAVKAAEQIIKGPGRGAERLRYVVDQIEAHGFTADITAIEAAVKDMNEFRIADIFAIPNATEQTAEPTE